MIIRKALEGDAEEIWKVHTAAIRQVCSSAYPPGLIDEWTEALVPGRYLEPIRSLECVVAEEGGAVRGFCILNLEAGELHAIYVAPEAAGRGVGGKLVAWAEAAARDRGWEELFLKATLNAVTFYERCGFVKGATTSQPLPSGTPRECVEMRKSLLHTAGGRQGSGRHA